MFCRLRARFADGLKFHARTWDEARVVKAGLADEKAVGGWYTARGKRPVL